MPTFGDTTSYTNTSSSTAHAKVADSASPASSGTLQSINALLKMDLGSSTVKAVVYSDSSGVPGTLLAVSDAQTVSNTTLTSLTFNFSGANQISLIAGTTYWIGAWWDTPTSGSIYWGRGTTSAAADKASDTSTGPASTWGTNSTVSGPLGVYATYSTGVTTTSITKSLGYAVDSPKSITKSLKYTVKQTPSALTKSLRYTTRKSLAITKSLKYTIKTTNSAITKALEYVLGRWYAKEANASLPSVLTEPASEYSSSEYTNSATVDAAYVDMLATTGYAIHQFRQYHSPQQVINLSWSGKTTIPGSSQTIYLQIFNNTNGAWETIASNSTVAANTDFTLSGSQGTSLSSYYDSNGWIAARVYQAV